MKNENQPWQQDQDQERKSNKYLTSLELALRVNRKHHHVLRDIEKCVRTITATSTSIQEVDTSFLFVRDTYTDESNRRQPMYILTEQGIEVVAQTYRAYAKKKFELFAEAKIKEAKERLLVAEKKLELVTGGSQLHTFTQVAVELNTTAQRLRGILQEIRVLGKQKVDNTYRPIGDYVNKGFFAPKTVLLETGKSVYHLKITPQGRMWLLSTFGNLCNSNKKQ